MNTPDITEEFGARLNACMQRAQRGTLNASDLSLALETAGVLEAQGTPITTFEGALMRGLVKDSQRLSGLRRLCGYVENGSDTAVTIFQDDATRDWVVRVGSGAVGVPRFYGHSMLAALDAAIAGTPEDDA